MYMYLIGLLIGLGVYGLTYLFAKNVANKKRVLTVVIISALLFFVSITIIGGFEGMPFGVLSLGIFTIALLLAFFGKSTLWKKLVYTIVLLFVGSYCVFMYLNQVDYWVIKKMNYASGNDIEYYYEKLQEETKIKGYKTFTISEGNQAVVLSLGEKMAGNNIEVLDVKEEYGTTVFKIRTFYNQSSEKNPTVMIGLDRLQPEINIIDTDGTFYEKVPKTE
ncbi:hypothetical protein ACE38V_14995 [Cytobacillus sp. Hz8]|uniref:hypothetical protein n=1 Tax=Cytobacillus sp. Hz8 TaxID=3347168 RepID=UPI0035D780AC